MNKILRVPTLIVLLLIFFLTSFTHFNILLQHQNNSLMKWLSTVGIKGPWIKESKAQDLPCSAIFLEPTTSKWVPAEQTRSAHQANGKKKNYSFCSGPPQKASLPESPHITQSDTTTGILS